MKQDIVSPGITPPCGWKWVKLHRHDLDGWMPTFEMLGTGFHNRATATIETLTKVVKEYNMERRVDDERITDSATGGR